MKKCFYVVLTMLAVISCTKVEQPKVESNILNNKDECKVKYPTTIEFNGIKTLKFADQKSLLIFVDYIQRLGNNEQLNIIKELNVKTPLIDKINCNNKINRILEMLDGKDSKSLKVFHDEYNKIKDEYSKTLIFNNSDSSCIYPEIKIKYPIDYMICNENGIYLIGDSVVNVSSYKDYDERLNDPHINKVVIMKEGIEDLKTNTNTLRSNTVWGRTSDRRVFAELTADPRYKRIYLHCYAEIHHLWWWFRYSTNIHTQIDITPSVKFKVPDLNEGMFFMNGIIVEIESKDLYHRKKAPFDLEPNNKSTIYTTANEITEYTILLGEFDPSSESSDPQYGKVMSIKGKMAVWSRGVPYNDKGVEDVNISFSLPSDD